MTISPVSAVSFRNNYNQVNFGSKHKKDEGNHSSRPAGTLMKSVPLAALIAMSPLVGAQAQLINGITPNEKIVKSMTYKDPDKDGCDILFISNDGNDSNAEAIVLQHGMLAKYSRPVNGVRKNILKRENERQYLDTLKIVHERVKYSDGTITKPTTKYVVSGPCIRDVFNMDIDNGLRNVINPKSTIINHTEYVIDKELYDFLLPFMEKNSVKTEERVSKAYERSLYDELKSRGL